MLKAMEEETPEARITIADANPQTQHFNYPVHAGPEYLKNVSGCDVLIKSPGIPPEEIPPDMRAKITNSTQIFLDTAVERGAKVIGVTGSKGKSTTASLIAAILKAGGINAHLVGNIGEPAIAHLNAAEEGAWFVLEMSSYQLMDTTVSPHIAVITSFFPEHLDYHGTLEAYEEAKRHITHYQNPKDFVFFDATSPGVEHIAQESKGTRVACKEEDAVVRLEETHLLGTHNLRNLAIASMVGEHFGIERQTVRRALIAFHGLPHRLQDLGVHHGIRWVDDSISTTPQSTIAALDALGSAVKTIILGGKDRGLEYRALSQRMLESSVEQVILLGENAERIRKALAESNVHVEISQVESMEDAVRLARTRARSPTPICLLSPAAPSYDMFKNFEERGDAFARSALKD